MLPVNRAISAAAAVLLFLAGCSSSPEPKAEPTAKSEPPKVEPPPVIEPKPAEPKAEPKKADQAATFKVKFDTTKGPFVVEVTRAWAPIGAQRFYELVQDRYFDNAAFFRVVPNFIVQFGIAADPAKTKKWDRTIKDDPVVRTNGLGYITYATAGPNTRTTQLFINYRSNQTLDSQGFAPFGRVIEGFEVVQKIDASHGELPDQHQIERRGNAYLKAGFPKLDYIKTARLME
jgi:peptidyl-prolyl cis-trans isomerase A (cyclophilin A)